jgi:hypothetical protein
MKGYGGMARATIFPYTYLTMQNSMETFLAVCYKHMLTIFSKICSHNMYMNVEIPNNLKT